MKEQKSQSFSVSVQDQLNNPHFFHQEGGIHIGGYALADGIIEGEFHLVDVAFKAVIHYESLVFLFQFPQREVMGGNKTADGVVQGTFDQPHGSLLFVGGIGTFQHLVQQDQQIDLGGFVAADVYVLAREEPHHLAKSTGAFRRSGRPRKARHRHTTQ